MPTGNATADAMTQSADRRGEASVQSIISGDFLPAEGLQPTLDPASFIKQSTGVINAGYKKSGVPELFGRAERSSQQAVDALNIIDEQFKQEELKRLPLEALQAEVDDLQVRRNRVLPEILSDSKVTDFNAKLRIASKIQSMFDSEVEKVLAKKQKLEDGAASRAKLKADTMRSKASILDKQSANDKFLLTSAIDLFESGTGSMNDILEQAVQMAENNAKRAKSGGKDNPFMGIPGQDFTDFEIALFLKADKNFGRLDIPDSVGKNQKLFFNQRYLEWLQGGKPVRIKKEVSGPVGKDGVVPTIMQTLSAAADPKLNPFPEAPSGDLLTQLLTLSQGGGGGRAVGEEVEE